MTSEHERLRVNGAGARRAKFHRAACVPRALRGLESLAVTLDDDRDAHDLFASAKAFERLHTLRVEGARLLDATSIRRIGALP